MNIQVSGDQAHKITDWKNEPSLIDLKADLTAAKPAHDAQMLKIDGWNDLLHVKGSQAVKKIKGRSSVQPKLIRRQAEWRYSALTEPFLGSSKLFKVSPITFEDEAAAKQNELVLNYQFRTKLNRVKFVDDFVRATVDEGTCLVQVGWCRKTVKVKQTVPVWTYYELASKEEAELFKQALDAKADDPRTFSEQAPPELVAAIEYYEETGTATTAQRTGEETMMVDKIIQNHPTATIMDPKNVVIDPSCGGDLNKAKFVINSFETCKADLMASGKKYINLDKVIWDSNSPAVTPDHETRTPTDFNFKDVARKKVVAVEYWGEYDIEGDGILQGIVVTWIGNTLIRMELNPFPDGRPPFVLVPYLPVKRDAYGEPDAELLEDNQKILGAVSRGMIDLLGRSANSQTGHAKGMLDPINRRRYENGQDYEFNPNLRPAEGMFTHKYPELPQSALVMLNLQNQEAEALTGVKSFGGGISGEAYGEVAAGIRGVLDAASKREMAILRRLAKGMCEIGIKFAAMNAIWLSDKETIRITNTKFVEVKREDLAGNFDMEVDISTAEVDNQKSQDMAFMLQTMGPSEDPGMRKIILSEIAELKRMPKLAHDIRTYQPQPDPLTEQMKQLQLEEQMLKNKKIQSEIDLNEAKAAQAVALKDKANLDFVEQETGTNHERAMELQRSQSQGNQNLVITKAFAAPKKENETKPDIEAAVGYTELTKDKPGIADDFDAQPVDNIGERDALAEVDPRFSIGSRFYQPDLDPAANPNLNV